MSICCENDGMSIAMHGALSNVAGQGMAGMRGAR